MGGEVSAENTPGGGLTLVIELPAADTWTLPVAKEYA
jgi:signal transduction histidine kinase